MEFDYLTKRQRDLYDFICEISEREYSAQWMAGIERMVWDAVQEGGTHEPSRWIDLSSAEAATVMGLARDCGGWITWNDGPRFVLMSEWLERVAP